MGYPPHSLLVTSAGNVGPCEPWPFLHFHLHLVALSLIYLSLLNLPYSLLKPQSLLYSAKQGFKCDKRQDKITLMVCGVYNSLYIISSE